MFPAIKTVEKKNYPSVYHMFKTLITPKSTRLCVEDNSFDVIVVDSSDPVGPAEKLCPVCKNIMAKPGLQSFRAKRIMEKNMETNI